jgi:Carboxypeptidase regulatory-like domain/TonB dependent receptor-like, beta-barrel
MRFLRRSLVLASAIVLLIAPAARAQVQTGSITGAITDSSNALLPGVTVTLAGEKLIGGAATQVSDETGTYRFDRLPPGAYVVKFELQGFRSITRDDIRVSGAFVATVNVKLEVGNVSESITVTGESPTIDTKSNVQQTVLTQEVLEGVPSGRDPWSVAKLVAGLAVSTYDVGGTQSYQQSSFSAHGSSTADVSFNIDGANVNWPGGGGGSTMLYYDQGMFEEMNYMTSAIPAEVMAGGVSINMVTKDAGNKWKGDSRYSYSSGCLTPQDPQPGCLESDNYAPGIAAGTLPKTFLGNPTKRTYDFNLAGGGRIVQDKLWVNGSFRRWVVDKLVSAKNIDGTQAIDDNTLRNYSGKAVYSMDANQKLVFSYNWNNKIRGHRRDGALNAPDIASLVQQNPASSTQAKYTGIHNKLVFESSFSVMDGITKYLYQPDTPANAVRKEDATAGFADNAAQRHEENPNQRLQFDNTVSLSKTGWGGSHLFKGGVQFARLKFDDSYEYLGDMYLLYTAGRATQVREFNSPTNALNRDNILGLFVQDNWNVSSRLTLNLGFRFDHNVGTLPAQSTTGGRFGIPRSISETSPIKQNLPAWRTGLIYDPIGDGKTAVKGSYSRYALQVGIDRVLNVNPLQTDSQLCTWTDPNSDGIAQLAEISGCQGFTGITSHYADAVNGPRWPYSEEVTAGVEREVIRDMRLAVMYYHRTNRDQIGTRNIAAPSSAYTPVTIPVPNGPGGTVASPVATTATLYNLNSAFLGQQNNIVDNDPYLDTNYNGVDISVSKRMSHRWQMVSGVSFGRNEGGLNTTGGQSSTVDLNDPNNTVFNKGVVGLDSKYGFRLSGSVQLPWDLLVAGSFIANGGAPYVSTFAASRAIVAPVVALTRGSQTVFLSARGDERLPAVKTADIRIQRSFKFGARRIVPQLDWFNINNGAMPVGVTSAVGGSYLAPTQILAPRIARVAVAINF